MPSDWRPDDVPLTPHLAEPLLDRSLSCRRCDCGNVLLENCQFCGHCGARAGGACGTKLCRQGHPLESYLAPTSGFSCDMCGRKHKKGTLLLGCKPCNWDVCGDG